MVRFSAWLGAVAPALDAAQAEALALSLYGLRGTASELYAERDRNFRLDLASGGRAVLKVSNADADPAHVGFQVRALRHVNRADPEFPAPYLMATTEGAYLGCWHDHTGRPHLVRLLSWLPGECILIHQATRAARRDAGRVLARLDRALGDCAPDGAPIDLPWDLQNAGALRDLLPVLADRELQSLATARLDDFDTCCEALLAALPRQLIHNDLNPDNVLFSAPPRRRVTGIIDFGDMVEAPLVCDLAVAASYHLTEEGGDPLPDLLPLVRGYLEVMPLDRDQLTLLLPLVECRLLATLLIQGSRSGEASSFTLDELRPSAREAAARLLRLARNRRSWSTDRLLSLLA